MFFIKGLLHLQKYYKLQQISINNYKMEQELKFFPYVYNFNNILGKDRMGSWES